MTLDEYLKAQSELRWSWGKVDCAQFGFGWAAARTGRQLTPVLPYRTRDGAAALLRSRAGLERYVRDWMDENGFRPTEDPDDGDIGLAKNPVLTASALAPVVVVIRRGPWWITREPRGIGGMQFEEIPAWRIL